MGFIDLNLELPECHTSFISRKEMAHEFRQNHFLSDHGISAKLRVPPKCQTISGPIQDQVLSLLGSIPLYELCPTYLSRKPPRYPSLSPEQPTKTLSPGLPGKHFSQYLGSCEPNPRLAYLCRFRPNLDRPSPNPLRPRRFGSPVNSGGGRAKSLSPLSLPPGLQRPIRPGRS
jgi:hypothetical protein